ncbi:unnamed protein product [Rotaria sp. Silwood2]|nr:unnamed protein product [Rotaria sp. Silwood2]CAF3267350.1 unnamed protein product [Rotaria sp. Silwood2]CAF4636907.1 unnamed protein product [Rotaria sp. Silwood2]CAF4640182.1 unnamed protein product [Rotaria sp. Silwood2]
MTDIESCSKDQTKYMTSFSNVIEEEAESLLGFKFYEFYYYQTPIEQFITTIAPEQLKKKIFERLIDCILSEGFPEGTILPINESVVTDNVGIILQAIVSYHKLTMNRNDFILLREKQIISKNEQFGGNMEFIIAQTTNVENTRYVLVVEPKSDSLGKGLTQLLLVLKSIWDINNDNKMVYGLLTTGINWQLVTYDGQSWKLSEPSTVLLANMRKQEDRWLKNNTQILDVIYSILSSI